MIICEVMFRPQFSGPVPLGNHLRVESHLWCLSKSIKCVYPLTTLYGFQPDSDVFDPTVLSFRSIDVRKLDNYVDKFPPKFTYSFTVSGGCGLLVLIFIGRKNFYGSFI